MTSAKKPLLVQFRRRTWNQVYPAHILISRFFDHENVHLRVIYPLSHFHFQTDSELLSSFSLDEDIPCWFDGQARGLNRNILSRYSSDITKPVLKKQMQAFRHRLPASGFNRQQFTLGENLLAEDTLNGNRFLLAGTTGVSRSLILEGSLNHNQ